jgi:hypothetical protein
MNPQLDERARVHDRQWRQLEVTARAI